MRGFVYCCLFLRFIRGKCNHSKSVYQQNKTSTGVHIPQLINSELIFIVIKSYFAFWVEKRPTI